jgi:hypothetical protein
LRVSTLDITNIDPSIPPHYIRACNKPTGEYRLVKGALFNLYETKSMRYVMEEKLLINKKALTLSPNVKAKSIARIQSVLDAITILEKEQNENA